MTDETKQVISWSVNDNAIAAIAEEFKGIDAHENLQLAKAAKKSLTKMRSLLSEAHKETKAEALAFGRTVDAEKNRLLAMIREIEDPISDQLDEIKNKAAREEEERLQKIMDYIEGIQAFALDRHSLTLEDLIIRREELHSRGLDPDVTQERHEDAQLSYDEADLKLRLAIDAETTRIEDERKQAEIAEANAAKQKELDERQAKMDAEDAEREAIRRKDEDERRSKQDKEDRERQEKLDEQLAEIDAEKKRIRDENEAQAKADAKAEAEARAIEQAPDRDKLRLFANGVDHLINVKPVLETEPANGILLQAVAMLIEVAHDIRTSTEEMK